MCAHVPGIFYGNFLGFVMFVMADAADRVASESRRRRTPNRTCSSMRFCCLLEKSCQDVGKNDNSNDNGNDNDNESCQPFINVCVLY